MADKLEPLAVSATEAARLLDVSRPTLYQLLNRPDFSIIPGGKACPRQRGRTARMD